METKEFYRLVIYGDSITKGIVFDEKQEKYVKTKESFADILTKEFRGMIHAVGKFGNTIIGATEKLQNLVLKKNPDIVLLEFGGNDCDFDWEEIARHPLHEHTPKTDLNVFREKLINIIEILRNKNIIPVLMSLPPLDADRYFKWISKNDSDCGKNILTWLESISRIYWWHERYNAAILNIAEETNTQFIDVRGAFLQKDDFRKYICPDGIHPNEQGHELIATKIIEYTRSRYDFLINKVTTTQSEGDRPIFESTGLPTIYVKAKR